MIVQIGFRDRLSLFVRLINVYLVFICSLPNDHHHVRHSPELNDREPQTSFYREERDILLHGSKDWFTKLHFAFQDEFNLYLIMDYYSGGDFLTLISKYEDGLPESICRFYCTEIILALTHLHSMQYIHRDVVRRPVNSFISLCMLHRH